MLVSTIIEGAHHQRYFAEHLPSLTDVEEGQNNIIRFTQTLFLIPKIMLKLFSKSTFSSHYLWNIGNNHWLSNAIASILLNFDFDYSIEWNDTSDSSETDKIDFLKTNKKSN